MIKYYEVTSSQFVRGLSIDSVSAGTVIRILASDTMSVEMMEDVRYSEEIEGGAPVLIFDAVRLCSFVAIEILDGSDVSVIGVLYEPMLEGGRLSAYLAQKRIVFLGCARDCEGSLGETIEVLGRLGRSFKSCEITIFENNSRDNTRGFLNVLASVGEITVIGSDATDPQFPRRTERIAFARNALLDWIRVKARYVPDYVCWADMDGVLVKNFDDTGFYSCFKCPRAWEAVFPVADVFYYDIWALRHDYLCPNDYVKFMKNAPRSLGVDMAVAIGAYSRQLNLRSLKSWLKVDSAFGGMGIYVWSAISDKKYAGMWEGEEICEHVPFNRSVGQSGGRLYINPDFVVSYPDFERRREVLRSAYSLR